MCDEAKWVSSCSGNFPHGAVIGCRENKEVAIVARAWHEGSLVPGKLHSSQNVCYVSYGGKEHSKSSYEVLCHAKVHWVKVYSNGCIPPKALVAGHEACGGKLYVGRVQHNGTFVVGKVVPSHYKCYIPYCGKEVAYQEYEILVSL